ncbi:MAG: glycosyltransferase family 4 protein [Paludibacteraceae bacterium]|nr:glycosyltransferase family 4 protein [Paludibacteraceae bacterium]
MNILFDNIIYTLQRYGGISVVWTELLRRARIDKDLQVTELDYTKDLTPRFMERYRVPAYKTQEPTLFHSSYFRVLPDSSVKNITTVHDLTYHFYRHGLAKAVHLWEERRALLHSEAVICVSENTKRDLLRFYPWYKEDNIHVVYNGVGEEFFPIPSVEKKGFLLYVGNQTVDYKRFDVAQAVARMTGLELVTASGVTREQLNTLYNEALCLLYPSDYEGFGIPVIEAQKAGCPVIAQNASSIPEVIGSNGLMVQHDTPQRMTQEMAEIVQQLKSRSTQAVIEAGFANAKRFSWDKAYEQTKQVYENIYHNNHLQ